MSPQPAAASPCPALQHPVQPAPRCTPHPALLPHSRSQILGCPTTCTQVETLGQRALVGVAVTYMAMIVIIPFMSVFVEAFRHGLGPFIETIQEPDFQQVRADSPVAPYCSFVRTFRRCALLALLAA